MEKHNISGVSLQSGNSATSRTELDTHAASIVVGTNVLIINETGKTIEVGPFTKELGSLKKVKVVDCVVAHDCPYSGETRIVVMFNALYVPSMEHNLVPPFVVRRRGNEINDIPKIQCADPSDKDHSMKFLDSDVRIQFQLVGTTSYFDT